MEKPDLKSMTLEELTEEVLKMGEKKFRAAQIYRWMHRGSLVRSPEEMTNLPKNLRDRLMEEYSFTALEPAAIRTSALDGTRKYLFRLWDGNVIESVFMPYRDWNSVCVSSQVGCRMGCRFCASTIDGCVRSLLPGEMLDQVYCIQREAGKRVGSVVVMGSGEPLENYDALVKFIRMLSDENGLNLSQRSITVSTCGLAPEIRKLAEEKLEITLALSLHAPTDEIRKQIMPVANCYSLKETLDACREYFALTGRRITFEYSLMWGINDSEENAAALAALIGGMKAHVNLIPVNPVKERSFMRSDPERIRRFKSKLEKTGINVTLRRELGRDIDGACGQLRRSFLRPEA